MLGELRSRGRAAARCLAMFGLAVAALALLAVLVLIVAAPIGGIAYASGDHHANAMLALFGSLAGFVLLGPLLLLAVMAAARRLADLTRYLVHAWLGIATADPYRPGRRLTDAASWRDLLFCLTSGTVGLLLLFVPVVSTGAGLASLIRILTGEPGLLAWNGNLTEYLATFGLIALGLWTAPAVLRLYGTVAHAMLAPPGTTLLNQRIQHLAQTRTETLDTSAAEIRRIERDLHDGAQARLVAMGMTLDAAGQLMEENPVAARALLIEARDNSAKALQELRALVRGIHPPVLADRGLAEAIRALALDTPMRIHLTADLESQLQIPPPVESGAYFAVTELIANVSKHAQASQAWIDLRYADNLLKITVTDDGRGGADPAKGSGLSGIERRLAAFDGVLAVSSPAGGPTVVNLEIPCELP